MLIHIHDFRSVLVVLLTMVVVGCASVREIDAWSSSDAGPKPDIAAVKPLVMEHMKDTMYDPESARFSDWSPLYKSLKNYLDNAPIMPIWEGCVSVNGKNKCHWADNYHHHPFHSRLFF